MRRSILLSAIIFLTTIFSPAFSQEIYRTTIGKIGIKVNWNKHPLLISSDKLQMYFDYETAAFRAILDLGTLKTDNDSLNKILISKSGINAVYTGRLGIPFINTNRNGTERFDVEGKLDVMNTQSFIRGRGVLEHLYEGTNYACALNLIFHLKFSQITIPPPITGLFDEFQIEIAQTVLRKEL